MRSAAPNRILVTDVQPTVAERRYPVKRVEGEPVDVTATVVADGHDELHVVLSHQLDGDEGWTDVAMRPSNPGLDQWTARFTPVGRGLHRYKVLGWVDHLASIAHGTRRKLDVGQEVTSELLQAAELLERDADAAPDAVRSLLVSAVARLRGGDPTDLFAVGTPERPSAGDLHRAGLDRAAAAVSPAVEVLVERERALFSAWYELFPRSTVVEAEDVPAVAPPPGPGRAARAVAPPPHGTLLDVVDRLDDIAGLGFDVLYLPPVHPIGRAYRKGPNNSTEAGPDDPGSPWAIGAAEGGHTAVHPGLGTVDDVATLATAANQRGLELALDLAFQCSPDHPWVTEHPEWFRHRPDGTIQYAENPPKKYQDIYPLDFESPAWNELWEALLDVVEFWMDHGVTVFRVDNPHTKPFAFWEWLIERVHRRDPDVIFLSEAFTRPEVMHQLARGGFTQSYTYFTWRVSKPEIEEYATEVSTSPSADEFRPSFWPTTPDILPWHLQDAPLTAFAVRHLLAATLSPSYGVYGPGFELGDNRPAGNGKEEFADSEKYEVRRWVLSGPSLRSQIRTVNRARQEQLALRTLRTLHFHGVSNDQLVAYSKTTHDGPRPDPATPSRNPVLCVVNLDPRSGQAALLDLDLVALGVDPARPYQVHDLLTGQRFTWEGHHPYVELHPGESPGHVLRVSQLPEAELPDDGLV